ncbi:MAG: hypothetical protein FWD57_13580, partial [Polyangiaceae bacterium]|nr:hypothetical protein [Polyangiaceae bacterium]
MLPLCTLLLQRGVATLAEIEAALARQAQFGDDLVTNLLDVASVDEAKLVEVIADCYGMRASVPGRLPQPDAKTLKTVPAAIATRVPLLPLRISRDCLVVVVAAKVSPGVEHDVSFSLGLRLDQEISSRSRVLQGIERAYSIPLRRRHARIAARLDGQDDPSPSVTRPAPAQLLFAPQLPHGPAARLLSNSAPPNVPGIAPNVASNIAPSIAPTLPPPPPASPSFQSSSPRQSVPPKPRSGPFELQNARKALESASGNAEVIAVFFDFAKQFFEYTALFVVRDDLAEGLTAAGPGVSRDRIRGIGVPLDLPSVLSRARDQKRHVLDVPSDDGTDAALRQDLQRPMRARVLTVALAVRGRVVALLYGDDGAVDVELNMVSDVLALVPNVGTAMEGL